MTRALLIVAVLASSAAAAPKNKAARKHFDKGVTAYQKGDFAAAAAAFAKSNAIEADMETLFAWAQSERKLDHCDKAMELYGKLLAMKMPAENKEAIKLQVSECKAIVDKQKPDAPPVPDAVPDTDTASPDGPTGATAEPSTDVPIRTAPPPSSETASPATMSPEGSAWWKNPVGGALVGAGAIGLGVGAVFLVQGHSADRDKANAASYADYQSLADKAQSRGQLGVACLVAGGALTVGGIAWYATHKPSHSATVTGWLDGHSGGFAISGGF